MRYAELALIALPFVLAALWLAGLRHASFRALMLGALALAGLGAGLYWAGLHRAVRGHYAPARLEDGKVMPGAAP